MFKNRWWIAGASAMALIFSSGTIQLFSASLFIKPITEELGFGRGTLSTAFGINFVLMRDCDADFRPAARSARRARHDAADHHTLCRRYRGARTVAGVDTRAVRHVRNRGCLRDRANSDALQQGGVVVV